MTISKLRAPSVSLLALTLTAALISGLAGCNKSSQQAQQQPALVIINPYADVDWENTGRYKANFHTHTTRSDGDLHPHQAIDHYHRLGYSVLAITDHNEVTWPWTGLAQLGPSDWTVQHAQESGQPIPSYENRDPAELGMVAIQGNELSSHHHTGSFFSDHNGTDIVEDSLAAIASTDGLAMFYHPGRYQKPVEWYVDLYQRHPQLIGLEVYNQGDRYPTDRATWDALLTQLMPDRPVWGYSNDDMHSLPRLGRNWSIMLLDDLSSEAVRAGLVGGLSYFIYSPTGHDAEAIPAIKSIHVDQRKATITIDATDAQRIVWISSGGVVREGSSLSIEQVDGLGPYVRAELHGRDGVIVGTQPFGVRRP
jgi:hypothetical protein